ncbi:Hsp20/alpha crystallin family protein [Candidatus Amesbacteria bacterium]|nr:Hsp20/alpha crystallin family protein [Candidatus Amesbacteria bacterium]
MSFNLIARPFWEDDDFLPTAWTPSTGVTISEDEKSVYVSVSTPGLAESDLDVKFDKGVLWVNGEKKEEEDDKKRKFYRRSESRFDYRVTVPGDIDTSVEPDAVYKNGIMTVKFSKSPRSQPKKITVKSSK